MTGKGIVEMTANSMFRKSEMEEAVRLAEKHWQHLHTIPEKAFEEKETTAYIKKVCKEYPVDFISFSYYSSSCVAANAEGLQTTAGNTMTAIKNPYLKSA